jgi:hypothetical protein
LEYPREHLVVEVEHHFENQVLNERLYLHLGVAISTQRESVVLASRGLKQRTSVVHQK